MICSRFPTEGSAEDYQDDLVNYLRKYSRIPLPEYLQQNETLLYVEPWRRRNRDDIVLLKRGWARAEEKGIQEQFVRDAITEDDWVEVMDRVRIWEKKWEEENVEPIEGPIWLPPHW